MSIKKKLGMGVATAVLGLGLIGGGTFAYFSDAETTDNTFAAGTLDLSTDPTTIIDIENIKPGDRMQRSFELNNDGTLDISEIILSTNYNVISEESNEGQDLGEHIIVHMLKNDDKKDTIIFSETLAELKSMDLDLIEGGIFSGVPHLGEEGGLLSAGTSDLLKLQFEFKDNGEDQNIFQGDSLELEWTFDAKQTEGELR